MLEAVDASGYTVPTQIQAQAIPHILNGSDVVGIAQTGTGKTASFTLPMLTLLEKGRARARMPRTLILEPTRELAAQVYENFEKYGANHKLTVALLIGGVSFEEQNKKLERGADILIATPGRLLDHFERGRLLMTNVGILVIDEADRMLDMGFVPDIERICKLLPPRRQSLFFSATMPPAIQALTAKFLRHPIHIEVARKNATAETITQSLVKTGSKPHDKRETLREQLTKAEGLKNAIIFCNRKRDVATLARSLETHGFSVGALHGDMDQKARMDTLAGFKNNEITLLVASDVAARGLDIPDVSHVFNFDVPTHAEDYVHRIGRTGRAGREGVAITLIAPSDKKYIDAICTLIDTKIPYQDASSGQSATSHPAKAKTEPKTEPKAEKEDKKESNRRGSRRGKSAKSDNAEQAAPTADLSQTEQPRQTQTKETPAATVESQSSETAAAPKEQRESRPQSSRQRGGQQNDKRNGGNGRAVIGMGDHVPAFLLREVILD